MCDTDGEDFREPRVARSSQVGHWDPGRGQDPLQRHRVPCGPLRMSRRPATEAAPTPYLWIPEVGTGARPVTGEGGGS